MITHALTKEERNQAECVYRSQLSALRQQTNRVLVRLLLCEWVFSVILAIWVSPVAWSGAEHSLHVHVFAGVVLGGILAIWPAMLVRFANEDRSTRFVVCTAQVMFSALLIHLTGGRIETHFHVFGSLAIIAFYRDLWVFLPAVGFVALDHLVRGAFWPESVYGVIAAAPWRTFEHTVWVLFETVFLLWGVAQSQRQLWSLAVLQVSLQRECSLLEIRVAQRTAEAREKQMHLDSVLAALPTPIYWQSVEGKYEGCNAAFARHLGLVAPQDVVGKTDRDLPWQAESEEMNARAVSDVLTATEPLTTEEVHQLPDGPKTVVASRTVLGATTGELKGVLGTYTDITDRRALETQVLQLQKQEALGQLAAGIAHEINTPMQCVSGNVEFLKNSCNRLFAVIDSYTKALDLPERNWQVRMDEINQVVKATRFEHIRDQVPEAIQEASEAVKRVIEIVRAMKSMSHPGR
ncbi:MAG: PAS domain-containing protein [Pirellulales bacterium]|nr:PAS domain-containing protein [Pirellulales bacterium]